jgi:STAS domain
MSNRSHPPSCSGALAIRLLPGCTGLALTGDADITARSALHAALAALAADGAGEVHLDLTGLCFIDVACTRELFAITDRCPALRLIVHHPPASLLRITALAYPQTRIEFSQAPCPGDGRHQPDSRPTTPPDRAAIHP